MALRRYLQDQAAGHLRSNFSDQDLLKILSHVQLGHVRTRRAVLVRGRARPVDVPEKGQPLQRLLHVLTTAELARLAPTASAVARYPAQLCRDHLARDPEPDSLLVQVLRGGAACEDPGGGGFVCLCACTAEQRQAFPQIDRCCPESSASARRPRCGIQTQNELTVGQLLRIASAEGKSAEVQTLQRDQPARPLNLADMPVVQSVLKGLLVDAWQDRVPEQDERYHICSAHLRYFGTPLEPEHKPATRALPNRQKTYTARDIRKAIEADLFSRLASHRVRDTPETAFRAGLQQLVLRKLDTFDDAQLARALEGYRRKNGPPVRDQVRALLEVHVGVSDEAEIQRICQDITCLPPPSTAVGLLRLQDVVLRRLTE